MDIIEEIDIDSNDDNNNENNEFFDNQVKLKQFNDNNIEEYVEEEYVTTSNDILKNEDYIEIQSNIDNNGDINFQNELTNDSDQLDNVLTEIADNNAIYVKDNDENISLDKRMSKHNVNSKITKQHNKESSVKRKSKNIVTNEWNCNLCKKTFTSNYKWFL